MPRTLLVLLPLLLVFRADAAGAPRRLVFVHDRGTTHHVVKFELLADGTLVDRVTTTLAGVTSPSGVARGTLAYSKRKKLLFVAGSGQIHVLSVGKDGALAEVDGSPFSGGSAERASLAAIDIGKRTFLYVSEEAQDRVRAFAVGAAGELVETSFSPIPVASEPRGLTIARRALLIGTASERLQSFAIAADGSLVPGGLPGETPNDFGLTLQASPDGRFAYQFDDVGSVFPYRVDSDSGALLPLADGAIDSTIGSIARGTAVTKRLLYAFTNAGSADDFAVFPRDRRSGRLGAPATLTSGITVRCGAVERRGRFLLLAGPTGLTAFRIVDRQTGAVLKTWTELVLLSDKTTHVLPIER